MPHCNVVVIGASAGGITSLTRLVGHLPADFPAAIAVAVHVPEHSTSALPAIISRHGALEAVHARDDEPLRHGRIFVAPPGHHLLVKRRTLRVVKGPHENGHRPAVDPLFRTAARAHGPNVVGVVLSGSLDDGTAGLAAIQAAGGTTMVQDPAEAMFDGMPRSAIENVRVDFVGGVDAVGSELVRVARVLAANGDGCAIAVADADELDAVEFDRGRPNTENWPEAPSPFTCPECHGSLFELKDRSLTRFRCRTGHAYSPEALAAGQMRGIEEALWTALRALEENAALLRRLEEGARQRGQVRTAARFRAQASNIEARMEVVREALVRGNGAEVVD